MSVLSVLTVVHCLFIWMLARLYWTADMISSESSLSLPTHFLMKELNFYFCHQTVTYSEVRDSQQRSCIAAVLELICGVLDKSEHCASLPTVLPHPGREVNSSVVPPALPVSVALSVSEYLSLLLCHLLPLTGRVWPEEFRQDEPPWEAPDENPVGIEPGQADGGQEGDPDTDDVRQVEVRVVIIRLCQGVGDHSEISCKLGIFSKYQYQYSRLPGAWSSPYLQLWFDVSPSDID